MLGKFAQSFIARKWSESKVSHSGYGTRHLSLTVSELTLPEHLCARQYSKHLCSHTSSFNSVSGRPGASACTVCLELLHYTDSCSSPCSHYSHSEIGWFCPLTSILYSWKLVHILAKHQDSEWAWLCRRCTFRVTPANFSLQAAHEECNFFAPDK